MSDSTRHNVEVLVVDDDHELSDTLREFLTAEGYVVGTANSASAALDFHSNHPEVAVALLDVVMPSGNGIELMEQLHQRNPDLPIVIMTGFATIETAVDAIKRGAEDYLTKPFDRDAVRKKVGRLMEVHRLRQRVAQLEADLGHSGDPFRELIFVSSSMQRVVERARTVAPTDAAVLIVGETGTGKERLARAIHRASRRASAEFVPVNCGALPRDLIESELFGVRRGAYTGAYTDAPGVFRTANKGSVFLDEIGEMPKDAQVKLLRVLQDKEVRPVGSAQTTRVDTRIIAATNRTLQELRSNVLREDLYFRLATVVIEVPPLRTRREDILVLSQWFVAQLAEKYGRHVTLSRSALECLLTHSFPGNVRELENLLESVCALSSDDPQTITEKELRLVLAQTSSSPRENVPLALDDMEKMAIERAVRLCSGNRTKAAALLGISRDTLYRKIRELKADGETL
ncbi:MAG TPA: sigma-54 dependent transcriptional regulator [Terriglobales bacterium]|nr:sigma-54 dependent transcriptional regulator [Terriglobales bacterium]